LSESPLQAVLDFWKPLPGDAELTELSHDSESLLPRGAGVQVVRGEDSPTWYDVVHGDSRFRLFGAVTPVADVPQAARSIAEILTSDGRCHSHVLWFEDSGCVVVPFGPTECIDALRFERYVAPADKTVLPQALLSAYYAMRPYIPVGLKMGLRKIVAGRSDTNSHPLGWPKDDSLDRLMRLLLQVTMMGMGAETLAFRWFWPDGHPWAAVLTHDVETGAGLARVGAVMDLEQRLGLRSSFNLVPRDYEVSSSVLDQIVGKGFEAGVHGYTHDGLMFSTWKTYLERVAKVNEYGREWGAAGFRSPATYRNLDWYHMLEFEYDSSMTDTAPHEPQPGGCASCFPYMVRDVVELPITLPQDHTLFGILGEKDSGVWLDKLRFIREGHGMACVLTHPDPGAGYLGDPDNEAAYVDVLDYIAGSDAWTPLPRELAAWWRARGALEGDAREQDTATATLDADGRLTIQPPNAAEPGSS
jgi:peptidoglycan/xylan/chitin deacetylase (PgdA/CDA1 family)